MRIGDAAAAAGTTPRALRFYEQRGLLPPPARTPTGQRLYGPTDVARVRTIRQLLSLGMTIEDLRGCAERLHLLDAEDLPPCGGPEGACTSTTPVIEQRLAAFDAEIARLVELRERLAARITMRPPALERGSGRG
ncbi:MerR family transcriptional regulator [Streptacidiphilus sp. N1-12]|uniref:MerR family transcriptional regulator n=2 Tax=Streptacidiphilus alkalitolerans TaxID=3342712 RepID=A0ABV6X0W5_9ACTN